MARSQQISSPRFPKPFFRKARGLWYVQLAGRQINLGADRIEAFKAYHDLMAKPPEMAREGPPYDAVVGIIDQFLDWCKTHREPRTYEWYLTRL